MPPKQRITREMILEKSFAMFSREGMEAVNARSVAKALNCSTQPIFSYYSGMDDLKTTLELKAKETFAEAVAAANQDGDPFVENFSAYVGFAAREPRLFAHLFMNCDDQNGLSLEQEMHKAELIAKECAYASIDEAKAERRFAGLLVYAHGLAALLAVGRMNADEAQIRAMIAAAKDMIA